MTATERALGFESTFTETRREPGISYLAARLQRATRKAIARRMEPYDLTTLQYTTLSILGRRGELSNAQLARRAFMTPQAMSAARRKNIGAATP